MELKIVDLNGGGVQVIAIIALPMCSRELKIVDLNGGGGSSEPLWIRHFQPPAMLDFSNFTSVHILVLQENIHSCLRTPRLSIQKSK